MDRRGFFLHGGRGVGEKGQVRKVGKHGENLDVLIIVDLHSLNHHHFAEGFASLGVKCAKHINDHSCLLRVHVMNLSYTCQTWLIRTVKDCVNHEQCCFSTLVHLAPRMPGTNMHCSMIMGHHRGNR